MHTSLFCHHCQKEFKVPMNDILVMQLHAPANLDSVGMKFIYRQECFFKKLSQIKKRLKS